MADILAPGRGRVEIAALYAAYSKACAANGKRPVAAGEFPAALAALCNALKIKIEATDTGVYLLKVKLLTAGGECPCLTSAAQRRKRQAACSLALRVCPAPSARPAWRQIYLAPGHPSRRSARTPRDGHRANAAPGQKHDARTCRQLLQGLTIGDKTLQHHPLTLKSAEFAKTTEEKNRRTGRQNGRRQRLSGRRVMPLLPRDGLRLPDKRGCPPCLRCEEQRR